MKILFIIAIMFCGFGCETYQQQQRSAAAVDSSISEELQNSSYSQTAFTTADYDAMRLDLINNRTTDIENMAMNFSYLSENLNPTFLNIEDPIAQKLESYLKRDLNLSRDDAREFPESFNRIIYHSAVAKTPITILASNLPEKYEGYGMRTEFMLKEDIDYVANLLFGFDTKIDYAAIIPKSGQYWYDEKSGTVSFEQLAYSGEYPIVLDYQNVGDYYNVTVVFIYWDVHFPEYQLGVWSDNEMIKLVKDDIAEYCKNRPEKYLIQIKEDNGLLFFSSIKKI